METGARKVSIVEYRKQLDSIPNLDICVDKSA